MGKEPQMTRQGTRYEPYKNSSRRRASPPPDSWGIHAGSQDAQLNDNIFDFLEALNTCYGSRDLREIFRDHATQPGALGEAINTWIQYDEIRGPREPELAEFLEIQRGSQSHWSNVPGPIPGDESRTSRPPVGRPDAHNVFQSSEHPEAPTTDENYLQHTSQAVPGVHTSPGQGYPTRADLPVADSPPLSLLRLRRGGEAPEEQDSSGWSPPQPGDPAYRTFYLESRVSSLTVSPEPQINIEPQDDDSILMALHEEGSREEHERPPQPEPQSEPRASPQPEPKLRRSARIKAKKQEPKVKTPGKSTSRKRAVRKK